MQYRLTANGRQERQVAVAESGDPTGRRLRIKFARFGSGKVATVEEVDNLIDVVVPVITGVVTRSYESDSVHIVTARGSNSELTEKAFISEVAIMSRLVYDDTPPDRESDIGLYKAYGYACSDDYISVDPQSSSNGLEMFTLGLHTAISNSGIIQLDYDASAVFATHEDLNNHIAHPEQHPYANMGMPDASNIVEALDLLLSNKANKEQPNTFNVTLLDGVKSMGVSWYYKTQEKIVHLELSIGAITGDLTVGQAVAVLPEGYRPARSFEVSCMAVRSPYARVAGSILVESNGNISVFSDGTFTSIHGINCNFLPA